MEFINVHQGGISFHRYSLKLTKLSKYVASFAFNLRDEMSQFVIGVSGDLEEECHSAIQMTI